jgi:hypothetical protein
MFVWCVWCVGCVCGMCIVCGICGVCEMCVVCMWCDMWYVYIHDVCACCVVRPAKIYKESKLTYQAPVAHACNPNYLGSRDQEDHGLKPAWANSS